MNVTPRRVYLAVASEELSVGDITDVLHVQPDEAVGKGEIAANSITGRESKRTTWKLVERGGTSTEMSALLEAIATRIAPIEDGLMLLDSSGCQIALNIVIYHSPQDEGGRGFALNNPLLKLLAKIGASVDVDQYLLIDE